jgi:exodeoxyribonuclease V gamma subunit
VAPRGEFVVTLLVHRADATDLLADGLGALLAEPLEDPFAEDVVVVPARGVERWLTQRLSHRLGAGPRGGDGVCAGVRFLSPHSLVALLLDKERDDPWDPDRLVWPLLRVVDESLGEAWCATLAAHLGHGVAGDDGELRRSRRYSVARRLAGLFAAYAVQRPALVTDWREGRDTDGAGGTLDHDLAWQPELWRRLVDRVDAAPPDLRHAETLARLAGAGEELDLPPRLSLFGHTRLPVTEVELLRALGELRDVHLWLPQVSAPLWEALEDLSVRGPVPRADDPSIRAVAHPLLGSLGRDARELQRTLGGTASRQVPAQGGEHSSSSSLLGWLQHDLRRNCEPDEATRGARVLEKNDYSVQVHACHGASRQVDVLREVLVGLLDDDHDLEPRDILVMCPDIETFAPLIEAGFGLADLPGARDNHPGHGLRVRLADRALSSTNPLLALASRLAELAGSRMTATEVLDLAAAEPVRRRFSFTDDDLAQLTLWVEQSGVRWGLDGAHRTPYGLSLRENTWDLGLSRLLLGVTMAGDEQRHLAEALPVDDVSSQDVDLVGRFTEYVDRLRRFVDAASAATTIAQWSEVLSQGVGELAWVPQRDAWQSAQFDRMLASTRDSAGDDDDEGSPLLLADVRHLLEHRLGGRPTRSNFRTGTLTVCTMVPMRSVPHKVVCLLGLDDGVFPRAGSVDGDDVLARDPMTGERDVRSEDRQLFLDAILAARKTLVITYNGANEHTGSVRPPAVPLGELLDALDVTAAGDTVREQVLVHHPLQPFDSRNLLPGALVGERPFSFDRSALAGATAAGGVRAPAATLLLEPLPPRVAPDLALADLQAFLSHPVRAFLRSRLDVTAPLEAEETHDAIPLTLDGLERWAIGDRMLTEVLAGTYPGDAVRAEQLRGDLPPGPLGGHALQGIIDGLKGLVEQTVPLREGEPRSYDVEVDLGGGRRLTGSVGPVWGNRLVTVSYSRLAAKHRLRAWLDLLALSAARPDQSWTSHAVGRSGGAAAHAMIAPLDHRAEEWLLGLVDLYDRGMREPLPMPPKTACAYAEGNLRQQRGGLDAEDKARREWETDRFSPTGIPGEDADPSHVQVWGEHAPLECLLSPAREDEHWNDQPHRLGQLALRLWGPLLDGAERVSHL